MINVIKNEIVPKLKEDVPDQPNAEQLEMDKHLHKFMIVCDREIYSYDFFIDMWEERIAVSTYNKYVTDKWDEAELMKRSETMVKTVLENQQSNTIERIRG